MILKNPTFVLLDEATSALDTKTERNIQVNMKILNKNKPRSGIILTYLQNLIIDF